MTFISNDIETGCGMHDWRSKVINTRRLAWMLLLLLGVHGCFPEPPPETDSLTESDGTRVDEVFDDVGSADGVGEVDDAPEPDAENPPLDVASDIVPSDDLTTTRCRVGTDCGISAPCEGSWSCDDGACVRESPVLCEGDGLCLVGVCAPTVPRADSNGCIVEPATKSAP